MNLQLKRLKELSEVAGVSGNEHRIKNLLKDRLLPVSEEIFYDKLGSVIFKSKNNSDELKIMLAAHMDEVGFMVKTITAEGFLRFTCLGGWWEQVMLGQRVIVHAKTKDITGVIGCKAPHILTPEERKKIVEKKDMYIDIGVESQKEAEALGIYPGTFITPSVQFEVMADENYLLGKAWDDRIGCAIMADVVEALSEKEHPNTIYATATVQEEVGLRGALTSANKISPDVAIIIDTCVAGGVPGVTKEQASAEIGKGVAITIYDASMIPNTKLRDLVLDIAKAEKIDHQISFSEGGGTDAGRIHMQDIGVPSIVLSIPTRYIHSHQGVIHKHDYETAVQLILAVIGKLDNICYNTIVQY